MTDNLRVGPIDFAVERVSDLRGDDGKALYGEVKWQRCTVRIEADCVAQQQRQTMWHEVIHILLEQSGRTALSQNDEVVDSLAYGIMQVIRDNSWLAQL